MGAETARLDQMQRHQGHHRSAGRRDAVVEPREAVDDGDRQALNRDERAQRQIGDGAGRQHAPDERADDAVVAALPGKAVSRSDHHGDREQNPVAMPLVAERLRDQRASHHRQRQARRKSQDRRIRG